MKKLLFATGNKGKIIEAEHILGIPLETVNIEIDEVQSMDLEYVAKRKAEAAFKILRKPVIIDDVGVFIEAWNGFPGPFAKFILDKLGNRRVLEILKSEKNRNVTVTSAVGYRDGKNTHVFLGEVQATLAHEERGTEGWGFDPIIIPLGQKLTYAEMGLLGKSKLSHRKKALEKFRKFLDSQKK
ncbi:MAG: Non-canonical purine NTP pyrophosphatase [Microgenomates group bacterium GW2011_GWC1_38_14]|nr:MAG: Non-canonical purine NTP pyrophosphatase [Candidatus Levybacteria bacterium GW2011_GWA2_36_13]KKQ01124.1 MAG: Non-canonical purine NTP pyrophosphatase [Candidatus Levybacteria bacterium GW2011_GWB1_36_18]KKQ58406.1 MAG: Non-canonical purine NTP pyrophosphatase [Microgenomates group bacterium GW2011_GWC1_38_14]KKR16453.1 MAG: Non-canonical purine NTP pyrophosphatase [Candidatus Levybacteria bacterium GW2011_GWA1_39_34]OGH44676.1 MAG: non-canonical purine NTP pyrophosphatase, RdgB/HAM1 fa